MRGAAWWATSPRRRCRRRSAAEASSTPMTAGACARAAGRGGGRCGRGHAAACCTAGHARLPISTQPYKEAPPAATVFACPWPPGCSRATTAARTGPAGASSHGAGTRVRGGPDRTPQTHTHKHTHTHNTHTHTTHTQPTHPTAVQCGSWENLPARLSEAYVTNESIRTTAMPRNWGNQELLEDGVCACPRVFLLMGVQAVACVQAYICC